MANTQKVVGQIIDGNANVTEIKQDNRSRFLNSEEELAEFAFCLSNPWSDTSMHYAIHPDYHKKGSWVASKTIIVYDSIEAQASACGTTPEEAIRNVDLFIKAVIDTYSVDTE